ncbi:multidrug resistance-associated protein [Penicillium malachiteum]|uniref:Multidrug resistance-associated protein n=1 Tax=Penicillium malachiteum TaxID=1324776 RepID=A0AAD6HCC4_9EURO|nr:multidrug resistance-associated protein [Penicillium malachiteum]
MSSCPSDADRVFAARVKPDCPQKKPEEVTESDYQVILFFLLILNIIFLIFRLRDEALFTELSLASSILDIIAIGAAIVFSFLSDQRAVNPSYLLTLYFSLGSILSIPRLRSLWLIHSDTKCRSLWTAIFILTTLAAFAESVTKESILLQELRSKASKEELHGIWGRSLFLWINSVFKDGFRVTLQVDDLPDIDDKLCISVAGSKLLQAWDRDQDTEVPKKNRLLRSIFRAYLSSCLSAILPRLVLIVFKFCQPFLITAAVDYVSSSPTSKSSPDYLGQSLIGAYILEYSGMSIVTSIYWRQVNRLVTMVRAGLISIIHEKLMRSRTVDVKESEAITHMEVDVDRIVKNLHSFHEAWACMIEIMIAIWLLERQLGATCVVPALISVLSVVASIPVSKRFKTSQRLWVQRIGQRVITTAGILRNIKVVKMLGLNKVAYDIVHGLREVELQTLCTGFLHPHSLFKFKSLTHYLANIPADLAPFATFLVYALITIVNGNSSLLSARAFSSMSLISLLTGPLLKFIQLCPGLYQSVACFDRIEDFYTQGSHKNDSDWKYDISKVGPETTTEKMDKGMVVLENTSFSWAPDSDPVLQNLDLVIETKSISILTGPTGAGKSALLESIMGETALLEGRVRVNAARVAYCSQMPWILNDTVRNNIIGGADIDDKWYDFTLQVCCLKDDLQRIPGGDTFRCGSNGVALSGGQKQRIALARAVYSKADLIICDDIFSGLDSKTLRLISKNLLGRNGYFREAGRTAIITTQNRELSVSFRIMNLEDKKLTIKTPPAQTIEIAQPESLEEEPVEISLEETNLPGPIPEKNDADSQSKKADQSRLKGGSGVYRFYLQRSGVGVVICFAGAMILESACANVSSVWIQEWSSADEQKQKKDIGMYLGVYAAFFISSSFGLTAGSWLLFIKIINRTAIRMHSDLLKAVLGTELGSLVNRYVSKVQSIWVGYHSNISANSESRFSEDMTLIDMNLPADAINAVESAASCVTKVVIICIFGTYFTASMPVFALALCLIQVYYLRTSRQVRLLDIESKSLLVSHFLEAIQGVTMLRALGWRSHFQKSFESHFRHSQRPFYMLYCIQQWLTLVLDLIAGAMAVILITITVLLRENFSGGSVGVALYMIMTFNQSLTQLISTWISLETSIGAVFRVKTFMEDTPSEIQAVSNTHSLGIPLLPFSKGAVEFLNLTASYGPSTSPVLKDVSLNILPSEKIAVCGKSGSGKTSLVLALLQMMEVQEGKVQVDGINLKDLEPDSIRSSLSIVSQDQFFLPGPVRLNMDPHDNASDEIIEQAIRLVGLWDRISADGGLDMELKSSEWSIGEKQLLALARAMIIQSHILILDEATGSVDLETEDIMQKIITEHFKSHTVISVLHRFTHIHTYDRVVVIEDGIIIENDSPANLLGKETEFRKLYGLTQQST